MTEIPAWPAALVLDGTAAHTWGLFVDWCTATDQPSLPAHPETVAEFLADHPARAATHRRRVAAINAAHRQCGLGEPGRIRAVHTALETRRQQRLSTVANVVGDRLRAIPAMGWPEGLFGRRDAIILTLVAAGLSYADIAALRRGELQQLGHDLMVSGRRTWCLPATPASPEHSPAAVHERWAAVQRLLDRYATPRMLATYFDRDPANSFRRTLGPLGVAAARQPLVVSIDRWGYIPLVPRALTEQSIAAIANAHLAGRPPTHHRPPPPRRADEDSARSTQESAFQPVVLDDGYYRHGTEARRSAHIRLTSVGDVLDGVASRAEELLEKLTRIVDDEVPAPDTGDE